MTNNIFQGIEKYRLSGSILESKEYHETANFPVGVMVREKLMDSVKHQLKEKVVIREAEKEFDGKLFVEYSTEFYVLTQAEMVRLIKNIRTN